MKSKPVILLSILCFAFAGIAGYFANENSKLRDAIAGAELSNKVGAKKAESLDSPSRKAGESAETTRADADGAGGASASEEELTAEERQQRRQEARQERSQQFLDMLQDPERRLDFIERNMERLDQRYAEFFKTLNMSGEEIEILKTLMAERSIVSSEARLKMSMAGSDEEREVIRAEMQLQRELLEGDIVALLGEEQAGNLERYNDTLPFRENVEEFAKSLSYTDTPVSNEQSEALLGTYADLSKEFKFSQDLSRNDRFRRDSVTPEAVKTYFEERQIFDTMVLENAAAYLNDSQLASLAEKQILERQREEQRMQFMLQRGDDDFGGRGGPRGGGFRGGGGRGF